MNGQDDDSGKEPDYFKMILFILGGLLAIGLAVLLAIGLMYAIAIGFIFYSCSKH